ncbi:uncharacterized protein [Antedon mediterranea]|uniref:uncharacterized protein n=1 Tax=Antedon mediterranea TaxID=105859 RepID=UPI003AF5E43C
MIAYVILLLLKLKLFVIPLTGSVSVEIGHGKPAYVSTSYSNWYPSKINDGNINSCSHTGSQISPYIYIDLEGMYYIERVEITNRGDCCQNRAIDGVVRIGMSDDVLSNTACGEPITQSEVNADLLLVRECRQSVLARYVSVSIENNNGWALNLCEIKVFSEVALYNNRCYKVSDTPKTWSDAKAACESQFSTLLTINTDDERTHLTSLMPSFSSFWTGLNDIGQEGNPEWLTSDTPTYMNYDIAESGDESDDMDCFRIAANDGSLRHAYCNSEMQYICEKKTIAYKIYEFTAQNKSPTSEYVLRSMFATTPGTCSLECGNVDACSSFSFNIGTKECTICTSTGQDGELTDAENVDVYTVTFSEAMCTKFN